VAVHPQKIRIEDATRGGKIGSKETSVPGRPTPLSPRPEPKIALAYVGCFVPDQPGFRNPAFNRAGNMFQENLLLGLKDAGLDSSLVLAQRPLRAFPKSRVIWSPSSRVTSTGGLPIRLVPFMNFSVFRPLTVGMAVLAGLIRWGKRNRDFPHKIVYTMNLTEPPGLFTLLGARLIGAKAVASINDVNIPGETVPASLLRRLDFWLQKRLITRFDGLVVVSKRIIEDLAPSARYVRIDGGISEAMLYPPSNKTGLRAEPDAPFTIVSAGTLNEANGFIEILEAFSLLTGGNYRLRIAGAGPLADKVKMAAQADPRIEYCGLLTLEGVLALYAEADALINMRLTQRVRTGYFFPSKLMEYMASGVPVITTCTGHVEEEYGNFVYLLKDETPRALARIIERVASADPGIRTQKGKTAQEHMRTHSTWKVQAGRVADFIRADILHLE
jgi:glycosyltransferase involved in cell wall biosynthesis